MTTNKDIRDLCERLDSYRELTDALDEVDALRATLGEDSDALSAADKDSVRGVLRSIEEEISSAPPEARALAEPVIKTLWRVLGEEPPTLAQGTGV